jgi:hypothetical protein
VLYYYTRKQTGHSISSSDAMHLGWTLGQVGLLSAYDISTYNESIVENKIPNYSQIILNNYKSLPRNDLQQFQHSHH